MLSLTFYKGVPFDREQQNVLFVDNEKRNEFLSNYIVPIQTLEIKQFALLGTTNNPFLVVSLDKEPFNVNYLKVIQTIEKTGEERMLFYYIDNYEMVTPENVRLNLTMDFFQTYFNKYDMQENKMERPEIKNALVTQGHNFENGGETEEILKHSGINNALSITNLLEPNFATFYRLVVHMTTDNPFFSEIVVVSELSSTYDLLMELSNKACNSGQFTINNNDITDLVVNVSIKNAFFIPEKIIGLMLKSEYTTGKFSMISEWEFMIPIRKKTNVSDIFVNETHFSVSGKQGKQIFVGTGANNVQIPYNKKNYDVMFLCVIANDISIEMWCNNQMLNITQDFETNIIYDEYANYMVQSQQSRAISQMSKIAMGGAGVTAGISKLFKGDIFGGIATAGASIAGTQLAYMAEQARLNDMASKPANLINDTNSIVTITCLNGVSIFECTPANYDDIITTNNYFGFKCNGFFENLDINKQSENAKFRFCRTENLSLIGNFDYEIKERLESYFKRGIRIWYDKDNYLNGFEP